MTNAFLITFNCAKLDQSMSFRDVLPAILPSDSPDLLVFAFQELLPILSSLSKDDIPNHLRQLQTLLKETVAQRYSLVYWPSTCLYLGAVGLFVLSKQPLQRVKTASAACGMLCSSLKGACALRFVYNEEEYTVVSAHMSANEGFLERRIADSKRLIRGLDFGDGYSVIKPQCHTFFMGDLNFRTASGGPQVEGRQSDDAEPLLSQDELQQAMSVGDCFVGFEEAPVSFKPTYKYHLGTTRYNNKRAPSWCDRILFLKYSISPVVAYDSVRTLRSSDHEAVYLNISTTSLPVVHISEQCLLTDTSGRTEDVSLSNYVQFDAYLTIVGDVVIRGGLLGATTTQGRVVVGLLLLYALYKLFL